MKKILSLTLALSLCLSLCACAGTQDTVPSDVRPQESAKVEAPQETQAKDTTLALGEEIALDFVKIRFDAPQLSYSVGGSGFSHMAQDGMLCFSLVGTLENTGGSDLPVGNLCAEMVFNDTYTYKADATINDSNRFPVSVAPLSEAVYVVYAEIPEKLLEMLATCQVRFSLNEGFASTPEAPDSGDHAYVIGLDEKTCAEALAASQEAHIFFAECPILPTPENYSPVYQSSSSSSSHNGKVTAIRYSFATNMGRSDNIQDIYTKYLSKLREAGFSIADDTGSACVIYADGTKLASVTIENGRLKFEIVPGNENLEPPTAGEASAPAPVPAETTLNIGDTLRTDYVSMTLETCGSDMEIRSGSSRYGSYTYYTSENGDPYFYLSGTFQNKSGTPVDIRNIYVQFCFDDKYNYKGEVDGVSSASSSFINDVAPLAEVNYYIYTAVPQTLIDSFSTCRVKIGFTENFDYKVIDVNDLPQFNQCDDVFLVEIPG